MRIISKIIRKIMKSAAALLMTAAAILTAVLVYFGIKGYEMYEKAVTEVPVSMMYPRISSQEGFARLGTLPEYYISAVIAAEDKRFYTHGGVDPAAIVRALWHDIKAGAPEQGGSTITQQLAKNFYFTQEKKLERKFAEIFAAFEIEQTYTKDEILEMYVGSIYFGSNYYGIGEAARGYFEKEPGELGEYECALLAGIPNAPSVYSPDNDPELAGQRAEQVIKMMEE